VNLAMTVLRRVGAVGLAADGRCGAATLLTSEESSSRKWAPQ